MADNSEFSGRPEDPFVRARVPDPSAPPVSGLAMTGLLGDSDRPGRRRLYLNTRLDYYAEFRAEDVLAVEDVGPDQPPFAGIDATRITLVRDARIEYVRSRTGPDPFQVDAAGPEATFSPMFAETWEAECPGPTWGGCPTDFACPTANECPSGWTVCKPATCRVTQQATCDTCRTCGEATCNTCRGTTCRTCNDACVTLRTCATCVTCAATCAPTCARTCANTCRATCVPAICETVFRCATELQTHCNTCRCNTRLC